MANEIRFEAHILVILLELGFILGHIIRKLVIDSDLDLHSQGDTV